MLKQIMVLVSFFYFAQGMEPQLMGSYDRYDKAPISRSEEDLDRSAQAHDMNWLPRMYTASGLSHCMSRECFMVNALAKIKDAIADEENRLAALKVGAYLGGESFREDQPDEKSSLFAGNFLVSGMSLLATFLYWINNPAKDDIHVNFPPSIRLTPVQTSCNRLYLVLNETWGWDKYRECWDASLKFNVPCNITELGKGEASFCCWAKFDPECNKQIIFYMNNTYPILQTQANALYGKLYNHAKLIAGVPLYITASTIVTLNVLFQLAGYKYRRIMADRETRLIIVQDEETSFLETPNQD